MGDFRGSLQNLVKVSCIWRLSALQCAMDAGVGVRMSVRAKNEKERVNVRFRFHSHALFRGGNYSLRS